MKLYRLREEDKKFLWAMLTGIGIILFWRGVWEVSYEIPLLENVFFVLFVGLFIITVTGFMYRQFDVFGQQIYILQRHLHEVKRETKRGKNYTIHYYDSIKKDTHKLPSKNIYDIEPEFIVVEEKKHEHIIPLTRITKIMKGKETIWRK